MTVDQIIILAVLHLTTDAQKICHQQHMSLLKQKVNDHRGEEYISSSDCQKCKCSILLFAKQKEEEKEDIWIFFVNVDGKTFRDLS